MVGLSGKRRDRASCETVTAGFEEKTLKRLRCSWEVLPSAPAELNAQSAEAAAQQLLASILPSSGSRPGCGFLTERTNTLAHDVAAISPHAWRAFAELNVLLQHHAQLLRDIPLQSYHRFTRGPKATIFQRAVEADIRFPADSGAPKAMPQAPPPGSNPQAAWHGPQCWRPVWRPQALPLYLKMTFTILQTGFGSYADASICRYNFTTPPCLTQWCQKWGLATGPGSTLTLLAVTAHAGNTECMHVTGEEAHLFTDSFQHTLFVPVVQH